MKLLFPAALCLLLAACASVLPPPTPGTDAHQAMLHEQAREHFYALKDQERARRGLPPEPRVAASGPVAPPRVKATPKPQSQTWLFASTQPKPKPPATRSRRTVVRSDDTIYEPTAEGRAELREWEERKAREYQIYEAIEAKRLGKTPQTLTREERIWIRSRAY